MSHVVAAEPEMQASGATSRAGPEPPDAFGSAGMASVSQLFQFAAPFDLFLLFLGSLCSGVVGAAQPGMMLLFSNLINSVGTLLGGNDVSCNPCPRPLPLAILQLSARPCKSLHTLLQGFFRLVPWTKQGCEASALGRCLGIVQSSRTARNRACARWKESENHLRRTGLVANRNKGTPRRKPL